jgi:predicted dehydrogenase
VFTRRVHGSGDIRVGLVGYGLAGSVFHAPLIATTPGLGLAAVVTSSPERGEQVRRDYPGARVVPTADELFGRAQELELVVIASPNRTHVPLARTGLEHGLGVVVDKPLAATAAEGRSLAELARDRGLLLTVFHNRRWDGDFLTVRRLVADGALGRVLRLESRFERWRPVPKPGWRELGDPAEVGGLLYDLGSHLVDQALQLLGPATHVYAELDRRRRDVGVDDDVFVALRHQDGARSHLWASAIASHLGPRFRVLGDEASYVKLGLDPQEDALNAGARPTDEDWGAEPPERWGLLGSGEETRPVETERGAYERFYEGVAAALRDDAPPPVDAADAVAGLVILEAARRSAAEERVVALEAPS